MQQNILMKGSLFLIHTKVPYGLAVIPGKKKRQMAQWQRNPEEGTAVDRKSVWIGEEHLRLKPALPLTNIDSA